MKVTFDKKTGIITVYWSNNSKIKFTPTKDGRLHRRGTKSLKQAEDVCRAAARRYAKRYGLLT